MAAFYFMYDSSKKEAEGMRRAREMAAMEAAEKIQEQKPSSSQMIGAKSPFAKEENAKEERFTVSNDDISAIFSNKGGSISSVKLSKYAKFQDSEESFSFNDVPGALPAMSLAFFDPASDLPAPFLNAFSLVSKSPDSATYEYVEPGLMKIERKYSLIKGVKEEYSPYALRTSTKITNLSSKPLDLKTVWLCLGAVPPTESDVYGTNLALGLYDGSSSHFSRSSSFVDSSGFLGLGASRALPYEYLNIDGVRWGSIKNQFFSSVFTPDSAVADGGLAIPIALETQSGEKYMKNALSGFLRFNVGAIPPEQSWEISGLYYVGPKELDRLFSMGGHQEEVMNYGWFGFVSRPLSRLMGWIHSWISVISPEWGWGWSIIILTLLVRLVLWPLTSIQIKSAQRMAKMQGPIKEIREKYKDDPKRIQQETMKIYSEYGINPLAGCLPILIQIPIFIGLYYMLQTSCEIRFAHFLWIKDLSLPDTIASCPSVFGIPLHVLPLINAAVTFIQMHITPTPSTDKTQAMMFKLMPVILLLFFYNFPSGLVLYWLVQSLLGILQSLIIRLGADRVKLQKRSKPGFMQRFQEAMEQAQAAQNQRGESFKKLPLREQLRIAREDALKAKRKKREDALKGTMYEKRKKNPGGRSTPKKR